MTPPLDTMLSQYILYIFENFGGNPAQRDSWNLIPIGLPYYWEIMCLAGWTNQCQRRSERGGLTLRQISQHGEKGGEGVGESTRFGGTITADSDTPVPKLET